MAKLSERELELQERATAAMESIVEGIQQPERASDRGVPVTVTGLTYVHELPKVRLAQWTNGARGFSPSPASAPSLPAGSYTVAQTQESVVFIPQAISADELVVVANSTHGKVIAAVRDFWKLREKFLSHGMMHKRGILLYGPPGCGKTSTSRILAQQLVKEDGGVVVWGGELSSLVVALKAFREVEPDRPLVVVREDVETDIHSYGQLLLALLDGEWSVDRCVFIGTTNSPEQLPPTLLNRPSRFDMRFEIELPTEAQRLAYLESRDPDDDLFRVQLASWAKKSEGFSFAHLRELFVSVVCFGHGVDDSIKRLQGLREVPDSENFGHLRRRGRAGFGAPLPMPMNPSYVDPDFRPL